MVSWCGKRGVELRGEEGARKGDARASFFSLFQFPSVALTPFSTSSFTHKKNRFWIFYRCYHDGETLLFGHAPHFEHDDHHHGEEGGHGDDKKKH